MSSASNPTPSHVESIEALNTRLVESGTHISFEEYFKLVATPEMVAVHEQLKSLPTGDSFCIPHKRFEDFSLLPKNSTEADMEDLIQEHGLVEGRDYIVTPAQDPRPEPSPFEKINCITGMILALSPKEREALVAAHRHSPPQKKLEVLIAAIRRQELREKIAKHRSKRASRK